jgi:hypothetical protein
MPVDFSLATDIHQTLRTMDDDFTANPRIPLHAIIGLWDVVRDRSGWSVDISVYKTKSLPALKAWLILRCTDLMYVGVRRVVLRSTAFPNLKKFSIGPVGDTRKT